MVGHANSVLYKGGDGMEYSIAELSEKEATKIKALEEELGMVLIAWEHQRFHKQKSGHEKR